MAIATTNAKLAIMELDDIWEPGLPISPGTLGQGDRQQLLWGYPDDLWTSSTPTVTSFWCANTGMSGMTAGGDILVMGG